MDKLKAKVQPNVYRSLINANIRSLPSILSHTKLELMQITLLDSKSVEEVFKEAAEIVLSGRVAPASQISNWPRISTGCISVDAITKGGIPASGVTEIVGCSGVGKTQFCLQLSLMTQLPVSLGGLEKSVVYICTEDVFPVKRLKELATAFSNNYKDLRVQFEDNIFIEHIADAEQLKKCIFNTLPKLLSVKSIGLVVIDSIAGVFRSENLDVKYTIRSQQFVSLVTTLNRLAEKYAFATVCVNQVTDNIVSGQTEPCLGLAWSNMLTSRFNISRHFRHQIREFKVVFAPDLASRSCTFAITSQGLT